MVEKWGNQMRMSSIGGLLAHLIITKEPGDFTSITGGGRHSSRFHGRPHKFGVILDIHSRSCGAVGECKLALRLVPDHSC